MENILLNIINGLSYGMLLFLISVGLTTIFGVMGVLNFAHGSLFMLGAYLCKTIIDIGLSFFTAIICAPILVGFLGVIIERYLIRFIYSRHVTSQLILTFAILLIIDEAVKMIWGPGYHVVEPPTILSGSIEILSYEVPVYRFFLILLGPFVGLILWAFFAKTRIGKLIKASAMDREMAMGVGINVPFVYTFVFFLGCLLAGLGGVLSVPHQSIVPAMGERIIIESFIVVVVGGLGSFPGAFFGALILGFLESFGTVLFTRIQMALPYILLTLIILIRPRGLFGKE